MAHIEVRRLDHLLAVIETGSILGASEKVHLSQPALSRSLRDLEDALGVVLLERHPRGVRPTVYGELLAKHARLLRNQERIALSEIETLREGRSGHLRVGVAPSFYRILPAAIARLARTHPTLTFDVVEGTYDVLAASVASGDLEAAFTMFAGDESHEGLVQTPLFRTEVVLALGAAHPLAGTRLKSVGDLLETPWAIVSRPASLATRVRGAFLKSGHAPPARFVETDSLTVVLELLRSNLFVSALPREIIHRELRGGELVAKNMRPEADFATAGRITREGAVLPAALDVLHDAVETERKRMRLPSAG